MRPLLRPLAVALAAAALPLTLAQPAAASGDAPATRTVTGSLVQAWPESADGDRAAAAAPLSWVQPAHGTAVRVATADLADVPAGSTVRVSVGGTVADAASADGYDPAHAVVDTTVLAPPAATSTGSDGTTGGTDGTSTGAGTSGGDTGGTATTALPVAPGVTDQVTVVLALPPGATQDGTTVDSLVAAVDGPVDSFWARQTGGQVRFGVAATHGWVHTTADCSDPTALWAEAATAAGFTAAPGKHLLVYVSSRPGNLAGCSYGLAQVGSGLHGGGALYVRDTLPSLIAHELGHNLGLGHSSGRQCDGVVDEADAAAPDCATTPYRDYYDVMGASWAQMGTLDATQQALLGVLPADAERTVDGAGPGTSLALAPLGGSGGVRALRLTAGGTVYWLEYRAATGQDAWLGTAADIVGLQTGVLLHRAGPLPDTSLLLDGTPSPRAGWSADLSDALPVGTAVRLAGGFTVTVRSVDAAGATVAVTTTPGAAPAPAAAPAAPARTLPSTCTRAGGCAVRHAVGHAASPATGDRLPDLGTVDAGNRGTVAAMPAPAPAVSLAASSSTTVLAAAAAGAVAVLLGLWLLTQRLRRRATTRAARRPAE